MTLHLPLRARLTGAARHPVVAARVLAWRWRSDPALLADTVTKLVGAAAPAVGGRLKTVSRRVGRAHRAGDERSSQAVADWQAGHWRRALAATPPGSAQHERYAGTIAALESSGVPERVVRRADPVTGRVLHVVTNSVPYTQAGYTLRTQSVVVAQRADGLEPHVVTRWGYPALDGHFGAPDEETVDGVPHHRLRPHGQVPLRMDDRIARNVDALTALVARLRPAVVQAATPHLNGTPGLAAARTAGVPFVYEVRGFLEDSWASADPARYETDQYRLTRARETVIMSGADAVVTIAETMRDDMVGRGVDRDRIVVVPNAVDAALLDARPDGAAVRRELGIAADELVLGSVSSLTAYEGFHTLLEAAALLREQGCPVRVLIVGDGAERERLLTLADRLGLGSAALLPGRVPRDRALAAVAALDAMIVPRIDAPVCRMVTPLKPVEAMALGVPVIASDLPALAEVLRGGDAGALVPPESPAALAAAALRVRDDVEWRTAVLASARDEVISRRTWQAAARAYRELYRRLGAAE